MKNHLSIEQSQQFQTEYLNFKKQIEKITNESLKKELESALASLLKVVKSIDKSHSELGFNNRLPSSVLDNRANVKDLRQLIIKKLNEWNNTEKE